MRKITNLAVRYRVSLNHMYRLIRKSKVKILKRGYVSQAEFRKKNLKFCNRRKFKPPDPENYELMRDIKEDSGLPYHKVHYVSQTKGGSSYFDQFGNKKHKIPIEE